MGGGICFALLFGLFFFFFSFLFFFAYVLSLFQPCGRALVLVLGSNPLILTLNKSRNTANPNCELCNSLSRNHR